MRVATVTIVADNKTNEVLNFELVPVDTKITNLNILNSNRLMTCSLHAIILHKKKLKKNAKEQYNNKETGKMLLEKQ